MQVSISMLSKTGTSPHTSEDVIVLLKERRYRSVSPGISRDTLLTSSGPFQDSYAILACFKAIVVKKGLFLSGALEMQDILPFFNAALQPSFTGEIMKFLGMTCHHMKKGRIIFVH